MLQFIASYSDLAKVKYSKKQKEKKRNETVSNDNSKITTLEDKCCSHIPLL